MPVSPAFPADELAGRLERVRFAMAEAGLDGLIVAVPENIYYLTGLDHWGFFAYLSYPDRPARGPAGLGRAGDGAHHGREPGHRRRFPWPWR